MRGTELDNISSFVEVSPLEFLEVAIRSPYRDARERRERIILDFFCVTQCYLRGCQLLYETDVNYMSKMVLSSFQFNITHTRSPPRGGQKSPDSFSMSLVMFYVQLYLESKSNDLVF